MGARTGPADLVPERHRDRLTGLLAERHLRGSRPRTLLVGAAVVGLLVALFQIGGVSRYYAVQFGSASGYGGLSLGLVQWAFLGSVTLLALEYATGRLGLLWTDERLDTDDETDDADAGDGSRLVGDRTLVAVAAGFGLLGVVVDPQLNQFLVDAIVAAVAIHLALAYATNRSGDDGPPWSGLVVDEVRYEGGNTYIQLRNVRDETRDLSNAEIEDGFGNRHPLPGQVVLDGSHRTELFLFDEHEAFRPDPGQPLLLYLDGGVETILWETPDE